MSSSKTDKKLIEKVDEILKELTDLKKLYKEMSKDVKDLNVMKEEIHHMHSKVSDLSCKVDLDLSTVNLTNTSNKTTKKTKNTTSSETVKKPNIMTYFKMQYKNDPTSMEKVVSASEVKDLFKKHEDEIKEKDKKKASSEAFKLMLIYKELIMGDKKKREILKSMQDSEEIDKTPVVDELIASTSKVSIVETVDSDEESNSSNNSSSDEDSDDE